MFKVYYQYIGAIIGFILFTPFTLLAQKENPFRALARENQSRQFRSTLLSSDTISLDGLGIIYSLSIDATIYQPREASFTRIVLEDTEGHDYLVAESDWFRNDTTEVHLNHFCEETALLDGITPLRLKCYLAEDASLTLTGIYSSCQTPSQKAGDTEYTHESIKKAQVQNIVDRINQYNEKHHKLWRAYPNRLAQQGFHSRPSIFQLSDTYLSNLIYYDSGIFEMGEPASQELSRKSRSSNCIDNFDWRYRHGRNWWLTAPKNQGNSGFCTAFAAAGVMEGLANLYYNRNLNLDLSEQDIAYYAGIDYKNGASIWSVANWVVNNGIIDEATLPFQDTPTPNMPPTRPYGVYKADCQSKSYCALSIVGEDSIKRFLINKGPCISGFQTDLPDTCKYKVSHAMVLTGYGKVTPAVMYTYVYTWNVDTILQENDWRIGKTYWIFKNSYYENGHDIYDHGHDGYMYIIFNKPRLMHYVYSLNIPIALTDYSNSDIVCEDLDGDGYFNWGIGPKPAHCPAWAPDEPDGDDSDATLGPMNAYGFISPIQTDSTIYIDVNTQYLSGMLHISNNICIRNSSTLTLSCDLLMNRLAEIRIKPGSSLIVNGTIRNANIKPEPGSTLILNNGGRIITHSKDEFNLPVGANLVINEGSIE